MPDEITSTSVGEIIPAEHIPEHVQGFRYAPSIMGAVAWVEMVPRGNGGTFVWPRWDVVTPNAGTKTESTGTFSNFEATTDEETCAAGVVGVALDVSRESDYDARGGVSRGLIAEGMKAMQNRLEADALAVVTGANSTVGSDSTALSYEQWGAGLVTYMRTNPPGPGAVAILHPNQYSQLTLDLRTSASAIIPSTEAAALLGAVPGFVGMLDNVAMFVTPNIPTSGSGYAAAITTPGKHRSGLGVAVWQRTQAEKDPAPGRYADVWVLHARYGTTLTNNDSATNSNLTAIVSAA